MTLSRASPASNAAATATPDGSFVSIGLHPIPSRPVILSAPADAPPSLAAAMLAHLRHPMPELEAAYGWEPRPPNPLPLPALDYRHLPLPPSLAEEPGAISPELCARITEGSGWLLMALDAC